MLNKKLCAWLCILLGVLLMDQGSKTLALQHLSYAEPKALTPFFNLTLLFNTGAAFSFLAEAAGWQRWFFVATTLVISVVLCVWAYRLPENAKYTRIAIAMIIGGAIGNLLDRLLYGYVIDFIQLYYQKWYWPAFNIADSAICVGATILILSMWRRT